MFVNIIEKKVAFYTLGCKVNQYETDCMIECLKQAGCEIVPYNTCADIYVINTCAVTNMAERKSRQIINRAKKVNPEAVVVAVGCYVQSEKQNLVQELGIDIIIGNNCKKNIATILNDYLDDKIVSDNLIDINSTKEYEEMILLKPSEHCRAYVKVQDGCNNFCSYCIIPYTRGRIRSRELKDVIAEVKELAKRDIKEVVITGINLSSYNDSENNSLLELLQAVSEIDGIVRIRMGSLEPRIISEDFLEGISQNKKICPHFHLSLQSACNETLKRMNRKYTIETYMEKCELIRKYYDRPAITTDVIVGFPGETEEEFATTVANLEKLKLYEMHIFKYSKRNGTIAAQMPDQVDDSIKDKRSNILINMAKCHKEEFEQSFKGEDVSILVEEYVEKDETFFMKGHTDRYILLNISAEKAVCKRNINSLITVKYN